MIRKPVLAANWKMHKGPEETRTFLERFLRLYPSRSDRTVVFFPPAISIQAFLEETTERPDVLVGVQDVHGSTEGPHTGAISATMAAQAGASWGLAGHSERRSEFGDDEAAVALKLVRLLEQELQPILCVGETLAERQEGNLAGVLELQVEAALDGLGGRTWSNMVVAYEPVWAIGTGETATPEDAAEAHAIIRRLLANRAPAGIEQVAILYGGSVKPANIETLLAADGVDGVLVGGASLDAEGFASICSAAASG